MGDFEVCFRNSTPLCHRFLVWNSVGFITSRNEQGQHTIDIEFHDRALHRPVHFTDHFGFTMGALNERAAVFACNHQGSSSPSTIFFRPFDSWSANGEWSLALEGNEDVKGGFLCIRFFSFWALL